jgi:hypothetical protein
MLGMRRRCWRPFEDLPRLDVFAGGEFDEGVAAELVGICRRGGAEIADVPVPRLDAAPPSYPPFAVDLDGEIPALGPELEPVVPDQANRTATARVVERQFIGRDEPEEPAEGPGGQLVILTFCRKCCILV